MKHTDARRKLDLRQERAILHDGISTCRLIDMSQVDSATLCSAFTSVRAANGGADSRPDDRSLHSHSISSSICSRNPL
jgi:hypothetical protein